MGLIEMAYAADRLGGRAARAGWLALFGGLRRWHRYEVEGFSHLEGGRAALIVGYHGRPTAHDLCLLSVEIHDRLGYLPHGVLHGAFGEWPILRTVQTGLGFVTGDGPELAAAVARGEHVLVTPGGTREGCRSFRHRYRVAWGERVGYVSLAARYRLPIIPVAADGVDDVYIGLNDGDAWGRALHVPSRLPVWLGFGLGGVWPLSPPLPVKIRQRIGAPIELPAGLDPDDRAALRPHHLRVVAAVQGMLDALRASPPVST